LARINDISSTEKLLDLIRKKGHDARPASPLPGGNPVSLPPLKKSVKRSFSFKIASSRKGINVGVDIGHEALRMVGMARTAPNQWTLTSYETAPLDRHIRRGTPEFVNLVKSALTRFCGSEKNINIWAIMSAANVSVRHSGSRRSPKARLKMPFSGALKKFYEGIAWKTIYNERGESF